VTTDAALGGEAGRPHDDQERWYLNDQREFLLRSIDDAQREHAAGDLTDADFGVLLSRDQGRLAEVEAELAALGPIRPPDAPPAAPERREVRRRSPWRLVGIIAACLLIATGAIILVDHALSPSLPGQPLSGSVSLSKVKLIAEQLTEAGTLNNEGEAVAALQLYAKVLTEDPDDPVALAASGWLKWNYGDAGKSAVLMQAGRTAEKKAVRLAPSYYAGHLYLGLILFNQDHDASGAVKQFNAFLSDSPPAAEVASVAPGLAGAYAQAKAPLPAALATALSTTTTTSAPKGA
jgi:hypothetical protein